jgi:hypothetical protein
MIEHHQFATQQEQIYIFSIKNTIKLNITRGVRRTNIGIVTETTYGS